MNWRDTQTQQQRARIVDVLVLIATILIVALLTGSML